MTETEDKRTVLKFIYNRYCDRNINNDRKGDTLMELCFLALLEKHIDPTLTYYLNIEEKGTPSWYSLVQEDIINEHKKFTDQSIVLIMKYNKQNRIKRYCRVLKSEIWKIIEISVRKNTRKTQLAKIVSQEQVLNRAIECTNQGINCFYNAKKNIDRILRFLILRASRYHQLWVIRYFRDYIPLMDIKLLIRGLITNDKPLATMLVTNILADSQRELQVSRCFSKIMWIDDTDSILSRNAHNSLKNVLALAFPLKFKIDTSSIKNLQEFKPPSEFDIPIGVTGHIMGQILTATEYGAIECANILLKHFPHIIEDSTSEYRTNILVRLTQFSISESESTVREFLEYCPPKNNEEGNQIQELFTITSNQVITSINRRSKFIVAIVLMDIGAVPTVDTFIKFCSNTSENEESGKIEYKYLLKMYKKLPPVTSMSSKIKIFKYSCRGDNIQFTQFLAKEFNINKDQETHNKFIYIGLSNAIKHGEAPFSEAPVMIWLLKQASSDLFNKELFIKFETFFDKEFGYNPSVGTFTLLLTPYFKKYITPFFFKQFTTNVEFRCLGMEILEKHGASLTPTEMHYCYLYKKYPEIKQSLIKQVAVHDSKVLQDLFDVALWQLDLNYAVQLHKMGAKIHKSNRDLNPKILKMNLDKKEFLLLKYLQKHGVQICGFVGKEVTISRKRKRNQETPIDNRDEPIKKKRKLN